VEIVGGRVGERLDERQRAGDRDAAGQEVADRERHGEVHRGEGDGLGQRGVVADQSHVANMGPQDLSFQWICLLARIDDFY
jgi:YD repeat-containing protein